MLPTDWTERHRRGDTPVDPPTPPEDDPAPDDAQMRAYLLGFTVPPAVRRLSI